MTGVRKGKAKPRAVVQQQKARRQLLYEQRRPEREANQAIQKALQVSDFYIIRYIEGS
jgi:hypothetical protein